MSQHPSVNETPSVSPQSELAGPQPVPFANGLLWKRLVVALVVCAAFVVVAVMLGR